jgi:hypothetical protein
MSTRALSLALLDDTGSVTWGGPSRNAPAPPGGSYFPDNPLFARQGPATVPDPEEYHTTMAPALHPGRAMPGGRAAV